MSFRTWDVNGYGINTDNAKRAFYKKDVDAILAKAPETKKKVDAWLENLDPEDVDENVYDDYENDLGHCGVYPILTSAVSEIEDVTLEYNPAENGEFILFTSFYPWDRQKSKDKEMTTEKLDEIFQRYFEVAGDFKSAQYQS